MKKSEEFSESMASPLKHQSIEESPKLRAKELATENSIKKLDEPIKVFNIGEKAETVSEKMSENI